MDHVARADIAHADRDVKIVQRRLLQRLQRRLQHLFRSVHAFGAEHLHQFGAALVAVLLALLLVDEAADARARLAGDDEAFPGRARRVAARGHDLDLVAVLQHVLQRHQPAVDLRPDAAVAHLAVHGIGEIDRRRAARQLDQLALRREAENLILVQFQLGVLQEIVAVRRVLQDFEQVLHPAEARQVLGRWARRPIRSACRASARRRRFRRRRSSPRCGSAPRSSG